VSARLLYAIAVFLLVVGVSLPIVGVLKRGAPWGYRGHRGVVVELSGDTQVADRDGNKKESQRGSWLEVGDELRAGRFSLATGQVSEGHFTISDSGLVRLTDKGVLLVSGALDVTVPVGAKPLKIQIEGFDSVLTVRPAAEPGRVRVLADMQGFAAAHVRAGSMDDSGQNVELGQVLTLVRGQPSSLGAPLPSLALQASCDGQKLTVTAPAGVQVFAPGFARVSNGRAPLVMDVLGGQKTLVVSARDVSGQAAPPVEVTCSSGGAAPSPKASGP
jgi:hypothetical protein